MILFSFLWIVTDGTTMTDSGFSTIVFGLRHFQYYKLFLQPFHPEMTRIQLTSPRTIPGNPSANG